MAPNKFDKELFLAYISAKKGRRSYRKITSEIGFNHKNTIHDIVTDKRNNLNLVNVMKICDWMQVSVNIFFNQP